ncbi:MAG: efflux RND transporter permease subunit [Oligoflexales bacterium]
MLSIAEFFIKNYKFTLVLSLFVVIFGVMGLLRLNSESYPTVDFAMATVATSYDGASAEDVETKITKPIEDELRTVSGIKDIRSVSQAGRSTITIRADIDNVDSSQVMADLQRSLDRVSDLPPDLRERPKFTEIKSEEFPVIEIAVIGPNEGRYRDKIVDLLKEEIEDNKAVLNVRQVGFRKRIFKVEVDVKKLQKSHIGIEEVLSKVQARNTNTPGGKLEKEGKQKLIRIEGKIENKEDLENIVLRANYSGKLVRVKDIGKVFDTEENATVLTSYNGQEATLMIVNKKGGTDTLKLVADVKSKINRFSTSYKDKVDFVIYNNEGTKVENKLSILSSNAITGLFLVVFFLLLFLPGRIGIVASLSLPLGVLATLGFIPALDMNLNAITILALVIALGMLVDNSVVISENYARLKSEGYTPKEAAIESIKQLWLPITATVMTTIAAFLPMLVTKGIMGKFIRYIPIIVSISLLVSLVESFFLLPMRLVGIDKKGRVSTKEQNKKSIFDMVAGVFEKFIYYTVKLRYLTLIVFTGLLAGAIIMMTVFNKMVLFPAEQTEVYATRVEMKRGTTLAEAKDSMSIVAKKLLEVASENIQHVVTRAGTTSLGPIDPKGKSGDNVGVVLIYVNDFTKNNVSDGEFLKKLRSIEAWGSIEQITHEAMVNGPPVGDPVNATFRANNLSSLNAVINRIKDDISKTPGIRDVRVDDIFGEDKVYVKVDYDKAAMLGLDVNSIGLAIRTAISGKIASDVNLENKKVDIMIRLGKDQRLNEKDLGLLRIMDRRGNLIPLSRIAKLEVVKGTPQIKRFDFKRAKTLTASIDETKITAIIANKQVNDLFTSMMPEYPEVSIVFGGEAESTKESMDSLWNALVLSLIGIFALLVFLFNSFFRPMIIMTTIPLGLVGFSIAFAAHQKPISFLALIGIIGLGGIIVNSGIILISFIEQLRNEETDLPIKNILAKASRLRLRAVLVSSLTTISGLLPTAYGIGGSDAMLTPMTLAMAWGLTSGTILTLVWVPSAYAIIEDFASIPRLIFGKKERTEKQIVSGTEEQVHENKIAS